MSDAEEIAALGSALMRGLRVPLSGTEAGYEAFERHILLAIRFHRAARLNAPKFGERKAWEAYFAEHFPRGDEYARRLFEYWRNPLVKDERPGSRVVVSHGQPRAHWQLVVLSDGQTVETEPRLFIDLESMWGDFEESVDSFVGLLGRDSERRALTLESWRQRQWSVQLVQEVIVRTPVPGVFSTASATASAVPFRQDS